MRFGPTSLRLGSVLAKGLWRPQFRSDLKVSKQTIQGETSYIIKVPETQNLSRIGETAYRLLQLCDGTRTAAELAATWNELHPRVPLTEGEILNYLDGMDPHNWERTRSEKSLTVLDKVRDERQRMTDKSSVLYFYFTAWNPDRFLERILPYLRWLFTKTFVYISLLFFALMVVIVIADFDRIHHDTLEFYKFANKSAYDLVIFWFLLLFITAIHETGHGLTCKYFGGDVPQMGLMFMYFMPVFFTDCTDMVMFDRPSKRAWTILGGIWSELVLCALATFAWFLSTPGTFFSSLCYQTLLLTGASGVLINLNPLMKLDGYYLFREFVQVQRLREQSFEYLKQWARRHTYTLVVLILFGALVYVAWAGQYGRILGFILSGILVLLLEQTGWLDWLPVRKDVDLPSVGRRNHRLYVGYGLAAIGYSAVFLVIIALWFKNILTTKFGDWGYLITAWVMYIVARRRLGGMALQWRSHWQTVKEKVMAWRVTRAHQIGGLTFLALLIVPTSVTTRAEFVLEPGAQAEVRAGADGWVKEVRVREGEQVEAGAVLAVLSHPELETRATTVERERMLEERQLLTARARNDLTEIQKHQKEMERVEAALREARFQRDALTLRAPLSGIVTTPQVEQRVGEYVVQGDLVAIVADRRTMRARVLVHDWELEDVKEGAEVKLSLRAHPFRTVAGTVRQIMPAAALDRPVAEPERVERRGQELTNFFAVVLEVPNPDSSLREGMTGTSKITGRRYPVGYKMARTAWRWFWSHVY